MIRGLLQLLAGLFGGGRKTTTPTPALPVDRPSPDGDDTGSPSSPVDRLDRYLHEPSGDLPFDDVNARDDDHAHDDENGAKFPCAFPPDKEIPSLVSHADVPEIITNAQAMTFGAQATLNANITPEMGSSDNECTVTVRPALGTVNIRLGPSLSFEPPLAKTRGGIVYELAGASEPDKDDLRWYAVKLGESSGWIRSDLVELSAACANFTFIDEHEVSTPQAPSVDERFSLPVKAPISQGYRYPAHQGFDMASAEGTPIVSPLAGVCIRRVDCTKCTSARPNRYPNANFQCPDTWSDPAWGYGYGNFITVRYDYALLPKDMRDEMDKRNLTGGFAYILFAHLSRVNVTLGQQFEAGKTLGATGNTGCSTAPHLHFEVRIGKDETIDNRWSQQRSVHPRLMFET